MIQHGWIYSFASASGGDLPTTLGVTRRRSFVLVMAGLVVAASACQAGPEGAAPDELPFTEDATTADAVVIDPTSPLPSITALPPSTFPATTSAPTTAPPDSTTTTSSSAPRSNSITPITTVIATTTTESTTTTTVIATTTTESAPVLVWAEEFDFFDPDRWSKEHSTYGDGGKTLQCYTPQQVAVSDGTLTLTAEERTETCPNGSTRAVTSGMVRSRGVAFSPGQRIDYRVKLTPGDDQHQGGLWPALWSSGWAGGGWPTGGEWDGFEVMTAVSPKRTVAALHYANAQGAHDKTAAQHFSDRNFSDDWHVMSFDYAADGVHVWRMDGEVLHEVSSADTIQGWPAPFDQSMTELKINLALGGNPGPLDALALPATYEVDYIRVYELG